MNISGNGPIAEVHGFVLFVYVGTHFPDANLAILSRLS
jgi:hypothetical protein